MQVVCQTDNINEAKFWLRLWKYSGPEGMERFVDMYVALKQQTMQHVVL